jgi:hypothetical protein
MTSILQLQLGQIVHLNGIEKYVHSDARGEMVVENIRIWKNMNKTGIVAIGEHGEEVEILDIERSTRHVLHYKIKAMTDDGYVKGYVSFPFIDEAVDTEVGYGDEDLG